MNIEKIEQLDDVHFDEAGLVPIIVQHATTGEVLTLAWANREALCNTLESRRMWFYSRSRKQLWRKGDTSGNTQRLIDLHSDCDSDALIARVIPAGPACHTGQRSCFDTAPTLRSLGDLIADRARTRMPGSYTVRLLGDMNLRLKKLGEEATELALACQSGEENVASEAADLMYHILVAAHAAGVGVEDILAELDWRFNAAGGARSTGGTQAGAGKTPESPNPVTSG